MRNGYKNSWTHWIMTGVLILLMSACGGSKGVTGTYVVPVTQVVSVTEIYQILVTQVVQVTQIVQVVEAPAIPPPIEITTIAPLPAAQVLIETPIPATDTLLVWYDFEGDFLSSGVVNDISGNGNDAQLVGIVDAGGGLTAGQAILLTGDGYIQAQSNPVAGRNNVSFSLWFKTENPQNNYKLASGAWWNGGPGSGWLLATHTPEFWANDTQSLYLPGILNNNDNGFPVGEWIHEIVTYDGDHIREYTNGQLVNDWLTTGNAIGDGEAMAVGSWPQFSGYAFQGSIDEFKIFGWALSPEDVQDIYNAR